MQLENFIEIDGIPVKIEGERNLLEVISKSGVKLLFSAIIRICPFTALAVCAWSRTKRAE